MKVTTNKWSLEVYSDNENLLKEIEKLVNSYGGVVVESVSQEQTSIYSDEEIKDCKACNIPKQLKMYVKNSGGVMGRRPRCKQCEKEIKNKVRS